jgi:pyruvate/2-oxoglutarate dehydrogenase complex dihydrolipoamide dehydrogenase (E3) component
LNTFDFDLIVIGGGLTGIVAPKTARGMGKKVAMVEKHKIGGDCTWYGCVPSKTLIRSASVANLAKNLNDYGLEFNGGQREVKEGFPSSGNDNRINISGGNHESEIIYYSYLINIHSPFL